MFSLPSLSSFKPSFLTWPSSSPRVSLLAVPTHDISALNLTDKRLRTLKHLLKLNHINHAVLFNNYRFHNHTPHHLGSTYILGADADHLHDVYQSESEGLVPWADSPSEITLDSWRRHLGDRDYQRAYTDFFEDEVVRHNYDWREVVQHFLLTAGPEGPPLIHNLATAGLGHPLIHLGYAFELNSWDVAMEALTLAAVCHNDWGKYLSDPRYSTRPNPPYKTSSFAHILERVAADSRLDNLFTAPGGTNLSRVFSNHEGILLEHWNAWTPDTSSNGLTTQFREIQETVAALLISAAHTPYPSEVKGKKKSTTQPAHQYDFFLLHLLTTSHALRILLPAIPPQHHVPLLRQHLLLTIALYIAQLRPPVDVQRLVKGYETEGRGWDWCTKRALGSGGLDAHFVKGVRAMKVAGEDWEGKEKEGFWVKAGVRFAAEFTEWGGFGVMDDGRQGDAGDEC